MKNIQEENFSFKKYAWTQFKKNKIALVSLYLLVLLVVIALLSPILANDQPLYAQYKGNTIYPAFSTILNPARTDSVIDPETGKLEILQYDITDWRRLKLNKVIWAPIPYSPNTLDRYNRDFASPGGKQRYKNPEGEIVNVPSRFRHRLGTDGIGRDLASGLIHGTKIVMRVLN